MSAAASRQRQRKRRRAQKKLWTAEKVLAERALDVEAYERVLADMTTKDLPPFGRVQAVSIVRLCHGDARHALQAHQTLVADLKKQLDDGARSSDPKETMAPMKETRVP